MTCKLWFVTVILDINKKYDYVESPATSYFLGPGRSKKVTHSKACQGMPFFFKYSIFVFLYAPTIVYIYMTDVRSDLSVMSKPNHLARHPLSAPR